MRAILVTGAFDDLGVRHVRLLHECSLASEVVVGLWSDAAVSERHREPTEVQVCRTALSPGVAGQTGRAGAGS